MDQSLYTDGVEIQASDLNNTHSSKAAQVAARMIELGVYGVTSGLTLVGDVGLVTVRLGQAYDSVGEAIDLAADFPIAVVAADVGRYVLARHLDVDGGLFEQVETGQQSSTRRTDGAQFYLADAVQSGAVTLGKIANLTGAGVPTFDLTLRQEWSATVPTSYVTDAMLNPQGDLLVHTAARGTGVASATNPHALTFADIGGDQNTTPQEHERRQHVDGVMPYGSGAGVVTPGAGSATVAQIAGTDSIVVDGARLIAGGLSGSPLSWSDGDAAPGLYEVWVARPTTSAGGGALGKTLRARWIGARIALGLQLVDLDVSHEVGVFALSLRYSAADGVTASWADGLPVKVSVDGLVTLTTRTGKTSVWWVDASALPAVGVVDVVEVLPSTLGQTRFALSNLWWFGLASTQLGYGDEGTGGTSYDRRSFGRTGIENIAAGLYEEIVASQETMRGDGVVSGGELEASGLSLHARGGQAWVKGQRLPFGAASFALPPSTVSFAAVAEGGGVVLLADDPDSLDVAVRARYARLGRVTTDAAGVIAVQDDRILLGQQDDQAVLGTGRLYNAIVQQIARLITPQGSFGLGNGTRRGRTRFLFAPEAFGFAPISVYLTQYSYDQVDPQTGLTTQRMLQGLEIALNCTWTPVSSTGWWVSTNQADDAVVWGFDQDGLYGRLKTSGNFPTPGDGWYDTDADGSPTWDDTPVRFDQRRAALEVTTAFATVNTLLMAGDGHVNALTPVNMIKAWALLEIRHSQIKLLGGFGVKKTLTGAGGSPKAVYLQLASDLDPVSGGDTTPAGAVLVLDDQGLSNPNAPLPPRVRGKLVTVSGHSYVKLVSDNDLIADGSAPGVTSNEAQIVYVAVTGAQTSTIDAPPLFTGYRREA